MVTNLIGAGRMSPTAHKYRLFLLLIALGFDRFSG